MCQKALWLARYRLNHFAAWFLLGAFLDISGLLSVCTSFTLSTVPKLLKFKVVQIVVTYRCNSRKDIQQSHATSLTIPCLLENSSVHASFLSPEVNGWKTGRQTLELITPLCDMRRPLPAEQSEQRRYVCAVPDRCISSGNSRCSACWTPRHAFREHYPRERTNTMTSLSSCVPYIAAVDPINEASN